MNIHGLCDAIIVLMQPLVEIVIHDIPTHTISYIKGGISQRKIGDLSLLDHELISKDLRLGQTNIYTKINNDGRLIKSVSVLFNDDQLICINCDISVFKEMHQLSSLFLNQSTQGKPTSLFNNDWPEQLHVSIHDFIHKKNWNFNTLSSKQKKELAHHLFIHNAFNQKNAADYVAKILNVGRATIFNYLKEWRS
jgi:predicted transcriptional regulator YheO